MIDLERNKKTKRPVEAKGKRTKDTSIYRPNQIEDFKISRGKFSDFLTCPRCFYLDRVKGLKQPGIPNFSLNIMTDTLLKKEFDDCRERQIPHRLFLKYGLDNVVPFKHQDIDLWRRSLNGGLQIRYKNKNIILTGGIDDIWIDLSTQELIVVDYKSQSKQHEVNKEEYLNDPYHEGYKIQMDFYAYLLIKMGYKVSKKSYFLVCNAVDNKEGFLGQMKFDEYLIPYEWNMDWIENKVDAMIDLINQERIPSSNFACNNCAYSNQYANHLNFSDQKKVLSTSDENKQELNDKLNQIKDLKILCEDLKKKLNDKIAEGDQEIENAIAEVLSDPYYFQVFGDEEIDSQQRIEDQKLKETYKKNQEDLHQAVSLLKEMSAEHKQYEKILTDPNVLADYVSEFFGERGPYPCAKLEDKPTFKNALDLVNYFVKNTNQSKNLNQPDLSSSSTENSKDEKELKSAADISTISSKITVSIWDKSGSVFGSGVVISKNNKIYKILTAKHVLETIDPNDSIFIKTEVDQSIHIAEKFRVFLYAKYDLATIEFNSELSYSVALVGNSSLVKLGDDLWVSGYAPNYSRTHILYPGKLLGYQKEKVGYELLYSNPTTPGSSGGPVLNNRGELIGINHGGYIYSQESKISVGINIGVPIEYAIGKDLSQDYEINYLEKSLNIGLQKIKEGNFNEALTYFDYAVDQNLKEYTAYFYRAYTKERLNDYSGAISDYEIVINLNPTFSNSYNNIGLIKRIQGDNKAALSNYNLGLGYNPNNSLIYANRGFLKFELEDYEGALIDYNKSLKINPKFSKVYALRGILFLIDVFRDYQKALDDLNIAIDLNPNDKEFYKIRSSIREKLGDKKGSDEDLNQVKKFNKEIK